MSNRDRGLLAASVVLVAVAAVLALSAIDALVGAEWAKLAGAAMCVYGAFVLSTRVGPPAVVVKKKGDK